LIHDKKSGGPPCGALAQGGPRRPRPARPRPITSKAAGDKPTTGNRGFFPTRIWGGMRAAISSSRRVPRSPPPLTFAARTTTRRGVQARSTVERPVAGNGPESSACPNLSVPQVRRVIRFARPPAFCSMPACLDMPGARFFPAPSPTGFFYLCGRNWENLGRAGRGRFKRTIDPVPPPIACSGAPLCFSCPACADGAEPSTPSP